MHEIRKRQSLISFFRQRKVHRLLELQVRVDKGVAGDEWLVLKFVRPRRNEAIIGFRTNENRSVA
jgi:hypothetical protein